MNRCPLLALALFALLTPAALAQGTADPAALEGTWEGAIEIPASELPITIDFMVRDGAVAGTIDIPLQGVMDHPLDVREAAADAATFAIRGISGDPSFHGTVADGEITGTFTQGGQEFPFTLERAPAAGASDAGEDADAADRGDGALPLGPLPGDAESGFEGTWSGAIHGPDDQPQLEVIVRLRREPSGTWSGTIDVPAQGAADVPLRDIDVTEARARFTIAGIPGEQTFDGRLSEAGERLEGPFTAFGQESTFALERLSEEEFAKATRRPQDPVPPLPYDEVDLTYDGPAGDIAATLTVPAGEGPFPAALLISGSGAQDRDSALMGHRPFLVWADALARAGVATLRADDRGVGGTEGNLFESEHDDLVDDLLAGLGTLRGRSEIDPERIGLIGHSEGGYLAPLVAAAPDADVAFTVLLAAPAVGGLDVLRLQNRLLFETAGADSDAVEDQVAFIEAWGAAVEAGDLERANTLMIARAREQLEALPAEQRPSEEEIDALAQQNAELNNSPYMWAFATFQPGPALSELTVPTLAIYGNLDTQVPAVQSAGRMSGYLRVAGNPDYEVVTMDGLNHLLQPATTGGLDEYAAIDTTIAPEVLDLVTNWLTERYVR